MFIIKWLFASKIYPFCIQVVLLSNKLRADVYIRSFLQKMDK